MEKTDFINEVLKTVRFRLDTPAIVEKDNGIFCPYCGEKLTAEKKDNGWSVAECLNESCKENINQEKKFINDIQCLMKQKADIDDKVMSIASGYQAFLYSKLKGPIKENKISQLKKEIEKIESY